MERVWRAVGTACALWAPVMMVPAGAAAQGLPATAFEVGRPFPVTAFPALEDGRPVSVADFRGKRLILHIFASW